MPEVLRPRPGDGHRREAERRAGGAPFLVIPGGKSPETRALVLAIDFVVTLAVGAVGGWLVDTWLGSAPRWTLVGSLVGVVVAVYLFAKGARRLNRDLDRQDRARAGQRGARRAHRPDEPTSPEAPNPGEPQPGPIQPQQPPRK